MMGHLKAVHGLAGLGKRKCHSENTEMSQFNSSTSSTLTITESIFGAQNATTRFIMKLQDCFLMLISQKLHAAAIKVPHLMWQLLKNRKQLMIHLKEFLHFQEVGRTIVTLLMVVCICCAKTIYLYQQLKMMVQIFFESSNLVIQNT